MTTSFIEKQFPVSKVSKESYKERKAVQSQTLTGLGKWWGRKPLVLVRAAILGCLLPATGNPEKDMDIFLKIMSMDDEGLLMRKEKRISASDLYEIIQKNKILQAKYGEMFDLSGEKPKMKKEAPKDEIESAAFNTLSYDERIALCKRPEQLENISEQAWREINHHLGTDANNLMELVNQLSVKRYGHNVVVGDCFCGGGSIPFEAARVGCDAYGSDLNPIAGLLTWADIHICGTDTKGAEDIRAFQRAVYDHVDQELLELGVESNENGDRADAYLYCMETVCPECGYKVPMSASWLIGQGSRTIATLHENICGFDINVKMDVSDDELKTAKSGTVVDNGLICPHCNKVTPVSVLRHDRVDKNGNTIYGLRKWEKNEFEPRSNDVFTQRLYAIRYKKPDGTRYYREPNEHDLHNESIIRDIIAKNIDKWQKDGLIPSKEIEEGFNTSQLIRERGWKYWHQLFNARQLLEYVLIQKWSIELADTKEKQVTALLSLHRCLNWNSQLCSWGVGQARESIAQTFYNQALNTLWNYGTRGLSLLSGVFFLSINLNKVNVANTQVEICDARNIHIDADMWITDPPYADAVNYHELTEFFLAWDKALMSKAFPEWYTDSKRILAVRGDEHFSQTMIDIYSTLTCHMNDNGMQVVMFTHSDPAVWAQLALIMWKAGLTVTAAWNISTETDASGFKDGNYVKGTVLLILRKQQGNEEAFLDELTSDIKKEVKKQIDSMQALDDRENPNFSDPDYVLAAYAASLKVLTSYRSIGEIDLDYELNLAINDPSKSEVVKLIERAKKIAYDCIIPIDFDSYLWKELSAAERFYIKGLEAEKHDNYQISTYQEYARGFGLSNYGKMMASEKANTARLKTPSELAMRSINEVPSFENSTLRIILAAVYVAIKEDEDPYKGLWHLKLNLPDYWGSRELIKQVLTYLSDTQYVDKMSAWHHDAKMAEHIRVLVDNDHI